MFFLFFFFFNDTATTEIYTLSLHDALPISRGAVGEAMDPPRGGAPARHSHQLDELSGRADPNAHWPVTRRPGDAGGDQHRAARPRDAGHVVTGMPPFGAKQVLNPTPMRGFGAKRAKKRKKEPSHFGRAPPRGCEFF